MRMSHVKWIKHDAFTLKPDAIEPVDWFFSDLICEPARLSELVGTWAASGRVKNFVCTLKFKGPTDFAAIERFRLKGGKIRHLFHNKHELTWWLTKA
jgi:23S rRNA (cytidine2498-2'-O)-methyltransferase